MGTARAGGLQRVAQIADPSDTRIAGAARELHDVVVRQQGPDGPLARRHLQREPTFGPFASFTAAWDPTEQS